MRAWEILEYRQPRSKPVTLRNLNSLKHSQRVNDEAERIAVKVPDNFRAVTVQTARLDDLGISDIGFMKIDVEGFESQVL